MRSRSATLDLAAQYSCDTLPPPANPNHRSLSPEPTQLPVSTQFDINPEDNSQDLPITPVSHVPALAARKLCVRHQRMADEGTIVKLQASLDALPVGDRETVSTIWSTFSSSSHPRRELILQGILTMCCFSQLSLLSESLINLIRLDPFSRFPREVALKVLRHLDAITLGRAAQVNRHWRELADDNVLWKSICEQHIDKQCSKCGWGLPLLEHRRTAQPAPTRPAMPLSPPVSSSSIASDTRKRAHDEDELDSTPAPKRRRSTPPDPCSDDETPSTPCAGASTPTATRLWKDVYCERLKIARNWKRGEYTVRTLKGHDDSVMCLQLLETVPHVTYPVLVTGSYDRTVRVWNLDTGEEVRVLRGHTRAVRALQFDEAKLITGSMDCTLRVWDWRTGRCIRTLQGHSEGVVCLKYDSNVLASGSVDATVKIWNFRTGECFTLRGHKDWVNSVQLWQLPGTESSTCSSAAAAAGFDIDPGKMLFSASDDCTIRLWDLARKTCVRQFSGHVGQVQSLLLLNVEEGCEEDEDDAMEGVQSPVPSDVAVRPKPTGAPTSRIWRSTPSASLTPSPLTECGLRPGVRLPQLISGSLDNTIRTWDIESGMAIETLFGHIEGVWSVVGDRLRLASGSHDKTIKVWQREETAPPLNLVGHEGPVTCLALSDDKIVSGSDDHSIKIWSFAEPPASSGGC
ncbi:WD40 repeat-like protein [Auriculariales sp. MPI-PUGE-AT-0066]|nr:WD40 repeat-like protein [Auriculariales sp. MPI-PUGE-AT-0066]